MVPAFAVGPGGIPLGPNGMPSPMVLAEIAGVKRKRDPNKPRKPRQPAQADDSGRTCSTCGTSTTPKWRCGMTLCNACGLRTSKKVCAVHAAHVYHPDLILGPVIARHRQSKPPSPSPPQQAQQAANRQVITGGTFDANGIPTVPATAVSIQPSALAPSSHPMEVSAQPVHAPPDLGELFPAFSLATFLAPVKAASPTSASYTLSDVFARLCVFRRRQLTITTHVQAFPRSQPSAHAIWRRYRRRRRWIITVVRRRIARPPQIPRIQCLLKSRCRPLALVLASRRRRHLRLNPTRRIWVLSDSDSVLLAHLNTRTVRRGDPRANDIHETRGPFS